MSILTPGLLASNAIQREYLESVYINNNVETAFKNIGATLLTVALLPLTIVICSVVSIVFTILCIVTCQTEEALDTLKFFLAPYSMLYTVARRIFQPNFNSQYQI